MKFIKFIKRDFASVRSALSCLVGKEVPLWMFIPYYVILGMIALPLYPLINFYVNGQIKKLKRELDELRGEA